ncbi:hypothetical protein ACQ86K_11165 [Mucilaginibacter sp. P19]|uniref:hypothetical protein n=1 Tax=Mucilaginibacter sp. P19 TaxID=3423947 RepID=UPI003D679CC7
MEYSFFDRDLSWLLFNERILMEAESEELPVMERVNFLAIFSSNLDEILSRADAGGNGTAQA